MTIAPVRDLEPLTWPKDVIFPPGDWDSDEPELETYQHLQQLIYLLTSLEWWWRERTDFFAAGNLTVYYSPRQRKSEHFRGPDFFVVLDTERYPRKSWVVWEEDGKYPHVVIEVLSESTADIDRGLKKQIYQDIWRVPYYFWIAPTGEDFQGFIWWMGAIKRSFQGRVACCGAMFWTCIWVNTRISCGSLPPKGNWCQRLWKPLGRHLSKLKQSSNGQTVWPPNCDRWELNRNKF